MAVDDQGWLGMAGDGHGWPRMARDDQGWPRMASRRLLMVKSVTIVYMGISVTIVCEKLNYSKVFVNFL